MQGLLSRVRVLGGEFRLISKYTSPIVPDIQDSDAVRYLYLVRTMDKLSVSFLKQINNTKHSSLTFFNQFDVCFAAFPNTSRPREILDSMKFL